MRLNVAKAIAVVVCLTGAAYAQHAAKPTPKPPAVRPERPPAPPPAVSAKIDPNRGEPNIDRGPGSAENLAKLLKLTPEQRNKALSGLPPGRRAQIEKRLNDFQNMPEPERSRTLERLRRMQSLPPQKQNQVRGSMQKMAALPQPRRALVRKQLNQLTPLSDADRRAVMNTDEFRSKFTPAEQQIIEDVCLITPRT